jgi:uncharacterized protein YpmS
VTWKKAFVILLCCNLLIFTVSIAWLTALPKASQSPASPAPSSVSPAANIQVGIGQDAINTYLQYALTEQADVQRFLSSATIHFSNTWDFQAGIKLMDRVVPFQLQFQPIVNNGNVDLKVVNASMGDIPIPPSLLFLLMRRVAWPSWIQLNDEQKMIDVNFTDRPKQPYGVHIVSYNPDTQLLTLIITIIPKNVLSAKKK